MPAAKEIDPSESIEAFIANMIREARKAKGWRQVDLAGKVFTNDTKISEIEGGVPPDLKLGRNLDKVLDLDGALIALLTIREQSAYRDYAVGFLRDQTRARSIHEYSLVVPGLLQTPEYARAIMLLADPDERTDVDADVARRIERQEVLKGDDPPWLWVVLDEAALNRVIGSRKVMRGQLGALLDASERPRVHVQVLRMGQASIPGSISLLTAHDGTRTAYTEGFVTGRYMQDPSEVDTWQRIYDRLHAEAEGIEASREIIRTALGTHDD
ncbi:helix-turn-helix DNA binding protein [Streptomyces phage Austintatious]|uniref:Helix-turn-helix DNA binding protein n=1 Tax=Streptomyces phage Austintatious TaxID=2500795 RepID=A0A411AXH5_9CAUD|nr:DNA binding protein [Streptomyces phage Austintatious]QAX92789.1 helix-turn-helix DNA binding protein [Streptomyces phage Austintatious]